MTTTTPTLQSASLFYREGISDKEYRAAIEPRNGGYIVTFAYGRRASTLNTGTKTTHPVSLAEATKVFDKLIAAKLAKGYQYSSATCGEEKRPYRQSGNEGQDSGIRCQLLNAVDAAQLQHLLDNDTHCMQPKHDGRRLMVRKTGQTIIGINRRGRIVAIPQAIRAAVEQIPFDVLMDGEAVGDTLHAFDLLELKGRDLRERGYLERHAGLVMTIPPQLPALRWVSTVIHPKDKHEAYQRLKSLGGEGVVFKAINAPFRPGRPNSGGPQLKFKWVETASFIVTAQQQKRSVSLGLFDDDTFVAVGNVTIPPNQEMPAIGDVVECRYLYAYRESSCIYQPVYLGKRDDIAPSDCFIEQLRFKSEPRATACIP